MKTIKEPFNYKIYSSNPSLWKLQTILGLEVINLTCTGDSRDTYPLVGQIIEKDSSIRKMSWTIKGAYHAALSGTSYDITIMERIEEIEESKVKGKLIDCEPMLIAIFLDSDRKLKVSYGPTDSYLEVTSDVESIKRYNPDFEFLGIISLEQHPQVVELLLEKGFKFKS